MCAELKRLAQTGRGGRMNKLRWKWSFVDLKGDGRFKKERLKGKDKRIVRKWTLKKLWELKEKE